MSYFGTGSVSNLEQVLGDQAQNAVNQSQDAYAQKRKRLVAKEAASGRLMSGVSDYPLADLDTEAASAESDIYSSLAKQLGSIPAEDTLNTNNYNRNLSLAQMIGEMNKSSSLQEALGLLSTGGRLAGNLAMFA